MWPFKKKAPKACVVHKYGVGHEIGGKAGYMLIQKTCTKCGHISVDKVERHEQPQDADA
jgi:hypothetical protein